MGVFLRIRDLTFRYLEGRNILDHVSLEIEEGGITLLTGPSGCGKSTLAAVIAGLYPENGGVLEGGGVEFYGEPVTAPRPEQLTMLFQNPDLQFCMGTLRHEMRFCMENISVPPREMDGRVERAARETGTELLLDRPLHSLSGGEKQRAALACLLVMESRCILLDEPFANLDHAATVEFVQMLTRLGRTVIAIDHQVENWLDAEGNLVADEIIFLGEGGRVTRRARKITLEDPIPHPHRSGPPAVEFENLSVGIPRSSFWGGTPPADYLLRDASASFPRGCVTALLGPSGSGKTTTFLAALGQRPYEGTIRVEGQDIRRMKKKELYRRAGIVFQNPSSQFTTQNVADEVKQSLRVAARGLPESEYEARAERWLADFGLWEYRHFSPYMLSQGQQRKLAVLAVLAGGQRILFLDEPTYGQDRRAFIMEQLRQRTERDGLTVIFITHDEKLAAAWADKIYRLKDKKLIQEEF